MKKPITNEADAWMEVARRLEKMKGRLYMPTWDTLQIGLCSFLRSLEHDGVLDMGVRWAMQKRLDDHLSVQESTDPEWLHHADYLAPRGEVGPRIIAAVLLSLEAAEEAALLNQ